MKKLLVFLVFLLAAGAAEAYTPPDSCLKMICPNDYDIITDTGSDNRDSIKVDSCIGSPTYGKQFTKRYFELHLTQYPFVSVIAPNEVKRVADLRNDIADLKQQFQELEQELGTIYFKRNKRDSNKPDSTYLINSVVFIYFDSYQDINYILSRFPEKIDSLDRIYCTARYLILLGIDEDNIDGGVVIYPNPVTNTLTIETNEPLSGGRIQIYSINGQKLLDADYTKTIDVSFLPPGSYYLKYNNRTYKFTKVR